MSSNPSPEQSLDKQPPAPQQPVPPSNIHAGFDPHSGQSWLFPVDFVTPDYLPLIVEKTLYHNSLVILPNRFEVSFVAAVVMHNVYRWYPFGKVVFICSNRKATQDQRAACDRLMKFVPSDVVDMALKPHERVRNWATKRAFFITSHTMAGEMARQEAERVGMRKIKLVVIEDPQLDVRAHSAIIQKLTEMGANFRVLCVTTTHGKTVEPAQLKQWHISNIELQWGNPQEKPDEWLMNKKEISNIVTVLGAVMDGLLAELQLLTQRYLANLHACKQIANTSLFETITADHIRQERTRYELSVLTGVVRKNHFEVMRNFHMAEKLVLAHRILARDGVVALMDYFHLQNDALGQADSELSAFLHKVRQGVYTAPHPKFTTLDNFLREFFQQRTAVVAAALRILIVVERTDAVLLVNRILKNIPESKHRCLIGKCLENRC
uniref:Fanconi anemia group M protein homolog n=1 Tax=Culex pipiens TaxID=7175 RepID=A0A8D8H867_CULPI